MPQTYETSSAPVLGTWLGRLAAAGGLIVAASLALAQGTGPATAPPPGPAPTGLVVGSGNPFSPIVADLDAAVAFYRAIGFEVRGEPGNADANPQLRAMFGLPDARLRWQIARVPPVQGGVEIIEIADAGGQRVERSIQEPGSVMLIVVVRDVGATLARLKALGAPVITRGGEPVPVPPSEPPSSSKIPPGTSSSSCNRRCFPPGRRRPRTPSTSGCGTPSQISRALCASIATRRVFRETAVFHSM